MMNFTVRTFWGRLRALFLGSLLASSVVFSAENSLRDLATTWEEETELQQILESAKEARLYLLGEASHGTHEFYRIRNQLTQQLIEDGRINFVVVEGDWNSLQPLNRYVLDAPDAPESAEAALRQIQRWPLWMWANEDMMQFGEWLRDFNQGVPAEKRVGIYGMDVYGMWDSLDFVVDAIQINDPEKVDWVKENYRHLLTSGGDQRAYIDQVRTDWIAAIDGPAAISKYLRQQLDESSDEDRERRFDLYQQARVVEAGAAHLRARLQSGALSWNHRAQHFKSTVRRLLDEYGPDSAVAVWAHNTHIGDARATSMAQQGQVNIGQLARSHYGENAVFVVGMGTAYGTVRAAREWEGEDEAMRTPHPPDHSLEAMLLEIGEGDGLWLRLNEDSPATARLSQIQVPHRAVGVIYHPEEEHRGNFVPTRLSSRYDAFIFIPETQSLRPLENM